VDDLRDAADSLAFLLQLLGHETCAAYDGPTALRAAASFRPDVALLDISLPGMDGYEVARRLRGTARLVAVSGFGHEEHRRRCLEVGFDSLLLKPLDLDELREVLAALRGVSP